MAGLPSSGLKATLLGALEADIATRSRCGVCGRARQRVGGGGHVYANSALGEGGSGTSVFDQGHRIMLVKRLP